MEEMYEVNHFGGGVGKRREDPDQPHANYLLGRKCLYCKIYLLFYRVSHWYFSFFVIIFKSIYVLWEIHTYLFQFIILIFFFALFVVVAVVVFQGLMIALGDFSAYNNTEVCMNECRSAFSWKDGWN